MKGEKQVTARGLTSLGVVYLVWGSTYLAIRVAVRPGAGIPPFTLGFGRMTIAGLIVLALAALRRRGFERPRMRDLSVLAVSGLLLWTGANGLLAWAEQHVDSSLAALMISTVPLWTVLVETLLDRRLPDRALVFYLFVGFAGAAVLSAPGLRTDSRADALPMLALILAPVSWTLGSVLQSRRSVGLSTLASAGFQQLAGGAGFLAVLLLTGEPAPQPTAEAWLAWGYLIVFGSVLGFSAFVHMLQALPMNLAMTYAYVNPVIAVLLGAWLLREPLTLTTIAGAALVLVGVAGVFHVRTRRTNAQRGQS